MRKMTYTQAATCGENLKVRVTPEQSEKMQKAWFAAEKTWADGGDNIYLHPQDDFLFLYDDGELSVSSVEKEFLSSSNKEIELIDELQHDFASQQEVWMWLGQGNQIKSIEGGEVYGFKNGKMWNFTTNNAAYCLSFCSIDLWQKYTPPRLIRVNGVEVPVPLESLDGLDVVYVADIMEVKKYFKYDVDDGILDYLLSIGLCYATKEDAIKRTEAMMKFEVVE
jgi:hypothetical protein